MPGSKIRIRWALLLGFLIFLPSCAIVIGKMSPKPNIKRIKNIPKPIKLELGAQVFERLEIRSIGRKRHEILVTDWRDTLERAFRNSLFKRASHKKFKSRNPYKLIVVRTDLDLVSEKRKYFVKLKYKARLLNAKEEIVVLSHDTVVAKISSVNKRNIRKSLKGLVEKMYEKITFDLSTKQKRNKGSRNIRRRK